MSNKKYITNKQKVSSWRLRRIKAGLSLRDFADITGKHVPQLSNYETGKKEPKASIIDEIEAAFNKIGVPFDKELCDSKF